MGREKSGIGSRSQFEYLFSPFAFLFVHRSPFRRVVIFVDEVLTIFPRSNRMYRNLTNNNEWMDALRAADVIFVATHSQGSIVSTHLIHKLLQDGHIRTGPCSGSGPDAKKGAALDVMGMAVSASSGGVVGVEDTREQRVCCLALCGIHLGPLAYLQKNSFFMPYIQVCVF